MCYRNVLALALLFCFSGINAQNTDSAYIPAKGWRLAGISIMMGEGPGMADSKIPPLFENTLTSAAAKNKWAGDRNLTARYNGKTKMSFNYKMDVGLRFTLKPKDIHLTSIKSYQEISFGVFHGTRSASMYYYGYTDINDSSWRDFITDYNFEVQSLNFDVNYTLQTPGLLGFLSFYTGPGIQAGITLKQDAKAYETKELFVEPDSGRLRQTRTILYNAHKDFSPQVFSAALYIPIGAKFRVSPRSNIFLEYQFTRQTGFFKNGYTHSQWYRGFYLGYRFKLGKKDSQPEYEQKNGPAKAPEPFY